MQVQLIVADEQHKGQAIPVNIRSFIIGRAEGCNLRLHNPKISRYHCTIQTTHSSVTVQDLGGENGTFVNGNRVKTVHTLKDGDTLVVGTHTFVISIQAQAEKAEANQNDFFELPPAHTEGKWSSGESKTALIAAQVPSNPGKETEIMFDVRLDGQRVSVTKSRLFDLARKGSILPDDLVTIAGTKVFADSIQGIVFGDKSSIPSPPVATSPVASPPAALTPAASSHATSLPASPNDSARQKSAPAAPVASADPFAFPDLGDISGRSSPFDHDTVAPIVRIARRESAFKALWNALDISFSRVYTMEGNNLTIHCIKALYYVAVLICILFVFYLWFEVGRICYEKNNILEVLSAYFISHSLVTLGIVAIIIIIRILLEMLLLVGLESAKQDEHGEQETEDGQ